MALGVSNGMATLATKLWTIIVNHIVSLLSTLMAFGFLLSVV